MKCGFVSITGRSNVGKSTLLNAILGMHLSITSEKSGTTRNNIQGIYQDDDSQIIFIDSPGVHKPGHKLESLLNKKAYTATNDVDLILFVVDIAKGFGKGDRFVLEKIKNQDVPIFLILNKVDALSKEELMKRIMEVSKEYNFQEIIPLSALKKKNINELLKTIKSYLKEHPPYYDKDTLTNISMSFMASELVREKILRLTRDEIPHSVTCYVEEYQEEENKVFIRVMIVVDRENIKKIIIGKNGQLLKQIGMEARHDLEEQLGKQVYLETVVKTIANWRDREKHLIELGLKEDE